MASLSTAYARWDRFAADSDDGAEPAAPAPTAPVASAPAPLDDDASTPTDDHDPDVARGLDALRELAHPLGSIFLGLVKGAVADAALVKEQ